MTLEDMKATYKVDKTRAVEERNKLETMRIAFSHQVERVSSMEARVSTLRSHILDKIMEREGLEP